MPSDLKICKVGHLMKSSLFNDSDQAIVVDVVQDGVYLKHQTTGSIPWFIPIDNFDKCFWKIVGFKQQTGKEGEDDELLINK